MDGKSITTQVSAAFIRGFARWIYWTFYDIKLPDLLQIEADTQYCLLISKTDGNKTAHLLSDLVWISTYFHIDVRLKLNQLNWLFINFMLLHRAFVVVGLPLTLGHL